MDWITSKFKSGPSTGWQTIESPGVELKPLDNGVFSFDFPASPGHVNYVTRDFSPVSPKAVVGVRYRIVVISGNPTFKSCDGGPESPTVRPMLQIEGDNWTTPTSRWWSNPECGLVAPGTYSLNVPLQAFRWSDVNGKYGKYLTDEFRKVLDNLGDVALTFGGHFFGHGVYVVGGQARFELLSFTIK